MTRSCYNSMQFNDKYQGEQMSVMAPCPKCGQQTLRRSRSKSKFEVFLKRIKSINPYRLYRCHNCTWRGWMSKVRANGQRRMIFKNIMFYISALVFAFLMGLWIIGAAQ